MSQPFPLNPFFSGNYVEFRPRRMRPTYRSAVSCPRSSPGNADRNGPNPQFGAGAPTITGSSATV